MVAVHFLPDHNTQEGTGKVICKPSVLDEKQLHLKQDRSRIHKVLSSLGATTSVIADQNKRKLCTRASKYSQM